MITDPCALTLASLREQHHQGCVACGEEDPLRLGLRVAVVEGEGIEGRFRCREAMRGYGRQVHGGVVALVLDCAMTQCLFAHGVVAVTIRMDVQYRRPLPLSREVVVRAGVRSDRTPRFEVWARIVDGNTLLASAEALFLEKSVAHTMEVIFGGRDY